MSTRTVTVTATRCYVGQLLMEIPAWCRDERLCGIVRGGGATSRWLSARLAFAPLVGTGLASCYVRTLPDPEAIRQAGQATAVAPLSEFAAALRADGLQF